QVPLTLPAHASLFTGLLPFQNGVRDNVGYRLEKEQPTLAGLLRARGYATAGAVSAFVLDHATGISSGFDFYEDRVEARGSGQAIGEVQRPGAETPKLLENWIAALPPRKPVLRLPAPLRASRAVCAPGALRRPLLRQSLRRRDRGVGFDRRRVRLLPEIERPLREVARRLPLRPRRGTGRARRGRARDFPL